jgi:hypothetical protein
MSNLRGIIYGEISLLCGQAGATMYNTTGLNNQANPNNTAPALLWNSFSEGTVALDYEVPEAFKNGPRFWVNDWINLPVGPALSFNGLNARWFAYPNYPPGIQKLGATANAYHVNDIARRGSTMGFDAGKSVYVLIDPSNNVYVMQAASQQVNPNETIQSLATLGSTLSLPQGWKYQVIPLTKELQISANGTAKVTTDSEGNSYDQCFETACSYNPVTGQ